MNKNNYIQTINEKNNSKISIIENMCANAHEAISDAEKISNEKHAAKLMLIKSSNDMSTQEKMTSMDKNDQCRNHERWQNVLYHIIISLCEICIPK